MTGVMGSQEPALVVPVLGNLLLKPGASNVENKLLLIISNIW